MENLPLIPAPRRVDSHDRGCWLPGRLVIRLAGTAAVPTGELLVAGRRLQATLDSLGIEAALHAAAVDASITLSVDPVAVPQCQGYRLETAPKGVTIVGHDAAGVFYGAVTLGQVLRRHGGTLPGLKILDWPDFPARGYMLDVSRDKVPTMATLRGIIDRMAELKLNQLQLYTEHTFAYSRHETVWREASPLTADEILQLDQWCREVFIELVPNQNSFGHVERWVKHPEYAHLTESPEGFDYPWGGRSAHGSTLCPSDPGSLDLLRELFAELLPNFTSRLFNVGCDETWELGQGRSKAACAARGTGRVYLDFLLEIHRLTTTHGRTMMFWGDIIMKHPELIPELPKDLIALEWGYEANHPFEKDCAAFRASGIPFYVCPGTSSWNSLIGRTENALANLRSAAEHGRAQGAIGYLVTDWGDGGHHQYLAITWLPLAFGAAYSWAGAANDDLDLLPAVSLHVFGDPSGNAAQAAHDLGNAYLASGKLYGNHSTFNHLLHRSLGGPGAQPGTTAPLLEPEITAATLDAAIRRIGDAMTLLDDTRLGAPDGALLRREFQAGATMAAFACRLGQFHAARRDAATGTAGGPTAGWAGSLAVELAGIIATHRDLWLARNREGGLPDSLARLEQRLAELHALQSPSA